MYYDVEPDLTFDIYESEDERIIGKSKTIKPLAIDDLQTHAQLTLHAWGSSCIASIRRDCQST